MSPWGCEHIWHEAWSSSWSPSSIVMMVSTVCLMQYYIPGAQSCPCTAAVLPQGWLSWSSSSMVTISTVHLMQDNAPGVWSHLWTAVVLPWDCECLWLGGWLSWSSSSMVMVSTHQQITDYGTVAWELPQITLNYSTSHHITAQHPPQCHRHPAP